MRRLTWSRTVEWGIHGLLFLCAGVSILTTIGIVYVLVSETFLSTNSSDPAFFQKISFREFFTGTRWAPNLLNKSFGVLPLLCGTFLVAAIAAVVGLPIGILSAIYLSEYADARTRAWVKPVLEILAGVPTVVYGYFGLTFVTPYLIRPFFQGLLGFDVDGVNIVGSYFKNDAFHGYMFDGVHWTTLDFPGVLHTEVYGVDGDKVVGFYTEESGAQHGFIATVSSLDTFASVGDYNADHFVNAADYVVWRKGLGSTYLTQDYDVWRAHFGQLVSIDSGSAAGLLGTVPEPSAMMLLAVAAQFISTRRSRTVPS